MHSVNRFGLRIRIHPRPATNQTKTPIEIVGIVPYTPEQSVRQGFERHALSPVCGRFPEQRLLSLKFASGAGRDVSATAELIRRTVHEVDGALPILSLKTFGQHLDANLELWIVRAGAALFSVFGGLALVLATVGVYGVKAYSVARRTREIGIRMALGAQRGTVQRMILREGAVMLAGGVLLGVLAGGCNGQTDQRNALQCRRARSAGFHDRAVGARGSGVARDLATGAARYANQSHGRTADGIDGSRGVDRRTRNQANRLKD